MLYIYNCQKCFPAACKPTTRRSARTSGPVDPIPADTETVRCRSRSKRVRIMVHIVGQQCWSYPGNIFVINVLLSKLLHLIFAYSVHCRLV